MPRQQGPGHTIVTILCDSGMAVKRALPPFGKILKRCGLQMKPPGNRGAGLLRKLVQFQ